MIANGIHETATPGGALEVTLTAGTDDGDVRISDHFSVGQTIQYVMKSSTASNDDWESGFGTVVTGNKFDRTQPVATYNGTTYDNSSPSRLTFTTACDVWIHPVADGVYPLTPHKPASITTNSSVSNNVITSAHITEVGGNTAGISLDYLHMIPYYKNWAGEVAGVAFRSGASTAAGNVLIALFDSDENGGWNNKLAEITAISTSSYGPGTAAWSGGDVYAPPGKLWIGYICSVDASQYFVSRVHHAEAVSNNPGAFLCYRSSASLAGWDDPSPVFPTPGADMVPYASTSVRVPWIGLMAA